MASAEVDTPQDEAIYTNSQIHEDEKSKFERRFSFRRTSLLPPPLPSKEGVTTLDRVTGTKPKIPKTPMTPMTPMTPTTPMIDHPGSPRTPMVTHPGSPRMTSPRGWDGDCSFESGFESSSKDETQVGSNIGSYKDTMLLHDTLKCLAVQESTKEAANVTINKFICLTVVITNILSISISILGTIVVFNYIKPTTGAISDHYQIVGLTTDGLPDQLPRGVHEVRDKREQSLAMDHKGEGEAPTYQSLTVDLRDGGEAPTNQSMSVDQGHVSEASTYQPLPVDQGQPLPVDQPHLDNGYLTANSRYNIEIRVTQKNESLADEEDELQDFWMS